MSVRTTADEKRDRAMDHIQGGIECLSEIVIGKCYGADEYNAKYFNKLMLALIELIKTRDSFR